VQGVLSPAPATALCGRGVILCDDGMRVAPAEQKIGGEHSHKDWRSRRKDDPEEDCSPDLACRFRHFVRPVWLWLYSNMAVTKQHQQDKVNVCADLMHRNGGI
jgi:hypothetical protein